MTMNVKSWSEKFASTINLGAYTKQISHVYLYIFALLFKYHYVPLYNHL